MNEIETETPPLTSSWHYNQYDDGPELHGRFENGWRFEIKPVDGDVFYDLGVPLNELDEWEDDAGPSGWSFIPFDKIREDLRAVLEDADSLGDLADADNHVVAEYGRVFEMLEREGL